MECNVHFAINIKRNLLDLSGFYGTLKIQQMKN